MPGFKDELTGERVRGITELLKRVFWPTYRYRRATANVPRAPRDAAPTGGPRGKRAGCRRGSAVDREVCACVNRGIAPTQPFAKKVLRALEVAGMHPVKAQVHVADAAVGLGTGVDLVCSRGEGAARKLVIVELKVGWEREQTYDAADGKMRGCLADLPNSPRYQHMVQTVVTRALFSASHPECASPDACVARVTSEGVHLHPVDAALYRRAPAILASLGAARMSVRRQKQKLVGKRVPAKRSPKKGV